MTTPTDIEYALMAGASYISSRPDINKLPVPTGWIGTKYDNPPNGGGFEAISFIHAGATLANSTEIVISFAGTNGSGDIGTDILLGLGAVAYQLEQAAAYYLSVKAANPNAIISFTGHSLGGGLASLLGAFFGEKAVTFDQAPFASAANVTNAQILRDYLASVSGGGFVSGAVGNNLAVNTALANLDAFINAADTAQILATRVTNISNIFMQGEVLSTAPFGAYNKLGTAAQLAQTSITLQPFGLSSVDLHSQALLTAFLQSPSFEAATANLPDLLPLIFDSKMYKNDVSTNQQNFLEKLVQSEAATATGQQSLLDNFATDMTTLGTKQNWPSIINDINQGNLARGLMAFAMQMYYENTSMPAGKTLFTDVTGGVQFDRTDVATTLDAMKGYVQYFKSYLNTLPDSDRIVVSQQLSNMRDWYVQAGAIGMNATDTLNRGAFMLGGTGVDTLTGGNKADLLVGNAGNDILAGGQGNDTLLGGSGSDTYKYTNGGTNQDGLDTILDSDGQGSIVVDGATLAGGAQFGDARVHRDASGHTYTDVGRGTVIDGNIFVQNWQAGNLGLNMTGPAADALPPVTITGTANADIIDLGLTNVADDVIDAGAGQDYVFCGTGNDVIIGGAGSDALDGFGGNDRIYADTQISVADAIAQGNSQTGTGLRGDALSGDSGDDTLIGSNGNDILAGGAGADLLVAGAGDDYILGDTDWAAGDGRNWGVYAGGLVGGAGGVIAWPGNNADVIYAGKGADHVWGELGNDVIFGEAGADLLVGGSGNDIILGGDNNDIIYGNEGDDILIGGTGNDTLVGGTGQDIYIHNRGDGNDHIYDKVANDFEWRRQA